MANIHSATLTFTHSLVTTAIYRSLSAWHPAPVHDRYTVCPEVLAPGRVNSLHCSYDLMCQSQSLSPAIAFRSLGSPCSLDHPLLVFGTFPTLSDANLFLMLAPLPRLSRWCMYPFLPTERRPSRNGYAVGSAAKIHTTTSVRTVISGLQSFLNVQASKFACHPGRSYRRRFSRRGSCDFCFRAPCLSLPSRTSDMLAV